MKPLRPWPSSKAWEFLPEVPKNSLPHEEIRFRALSLCPLNKVKVVILGQDPYHTPGLADGLAFSSQPAKNKPGSLQNIHKEYSQDLGFPIPNTNSLQPWAENGVLLLNKHLTVYPGHANSHSHIGWDKFTRLIIQDVCERDSPTVFILWGEEAKEYEAMITNKDHHVLTSCHPSPLSVYRGFFGSKPFSKTCDLLGLKRDFWRLT